MAARHVRAGRALAFLAALCTVVACGGGGSESEQSVPPPTGVGGEAPPPAADQIFESVVSGSVGDGPVAGATIRVFTKDGTQLKDSATVSSADADYRLAIKTTGKSFPLTIIANGGTDLVTGAPPDFRLLASMVRPSGRVRANLNPFSTLMVAIAEDLDGVSDASIEAARRIVLGNFGFGLDEAKVPDPIGSVIDERNVADMVKASEALGETIRRTRDALQSAGLAVDGDDVVQILGADLVDGMLDGRGARRASSQAAAVATIASAQVLVETMTNQLEVYGVDATAAMDNAIRTVQPNATADTRAVRIPAAAFDQARIALIAASTLNNDPALAAAAQVMASATAGSLPAALVPRFDAAATVAAAGRAVGAAAVATPAQLELIHQVVRTQAPVIDIGPLPNRAPLISGTPVTALVAGQSWSFEPVASDPDGDLLSFSAAGLPAWASFEAATGRISGTPPAAGSWSGITIAVTDGLATSRLEPFTLTATAAAASGQVRLRLAAPSEREDGSALTNLAGFRLHWGSSAGDYRHHLEVGLDAGPVVTIGDLAAGTYYFVATAFDSRGVESRYSPLVEATVN